MPEVTAPEPVVPETVTKDTVSKPLENMPATYVASDTSYNATDDAEPKRKGPGFLGYTAGLAAGATASAYTGKALRKGILEGVKEKLIEIVETKNAVLKAAHEQYIADVKPGNNPKEWNDNLNKKIRETNASIQSKIEKIENTVGSLENAESKNVFKKGSVVFKEGTIKTRAAILASFLAATMLVAGGIKLIRNSGSKSQVEKLEAEREHKHPLTM